LNNDDLCQSETRAAAPSPRGFGRLGLPFSRVHALMADSHSGLTGALFALR